MASECSRRSALPLPLKPPDFDLIVPDGDTRKRRVCRTCGEIFYENPRIIVAAICTWNDKVLFVRRSIEPRRGFWTFPSGYLEMNETTREGAAREVYEEAGARVEIDSLLAIYDLPHISQVHMIYLARMLTPDHAPGDESLESALLSWDDIPWTRLAYPTTHWALRDYHRRPPDGAFAPFGSPSLDETAFFPDHPPPDRNRPVRD